MPDPTKTPPSSAVLASISQHSSEHILDFIEIMSAWDVDDEQGARLLRLSELTLEDLRDDPARLQLDRDQVERLSYIGSINQMLQSLFDAHMARQWLRSPQQQAVFGGDTPLNRMLGGRMCDLYETERWLKKRMDLYD